MGYKPIILVADEIASVLAQCDSKQKKQILGYLMQIAQKGRSVGVFFIVASQSPATDVLPQGIRLQFSTKILLGSSKNFTFRVIFWFYFWILE